jgi:hypothetical protein
VGTKSPRCFPINEEKCFVEEIHRDMHSEKVMAKKSKPPVKVEKTVVKQETEVVKEDAPASGKEETTTSGKEGEGIDAIRILMAVGVLLILVDVGVILLRYVYHVI